MIQYVFLLVGFNFNEKCDEFILCTILLTLNDVQHPLSLIAFLSLRSQLYCHSQSKNGLDIAACLSNALLLDS